MNNNIRMTFEVAKWEFGRWFKIKEQIYTLLFGALLSFLIFGGQILLENFGNNGKKISVLNYSSIQIKLKPESKITLQSIKPDDIKEQKKLLKENEIDGILIINGIENIELIVDKQESWIDEIQEALNSAKQQIKIKDANISGELLNDIFKPLVFKTTFLEDREISTTGEKITAGIFIGLMLLGVFFGLAYQFVAITGEKQLRITEVILSAITPQMWIDGKIIGITLLSIVLLITYSASTVLFIIISSFFGSGWSLPISISNPLLIILLFVFSLGGFLFWNTFFSAIAATINDPNTSARGSLIALPAIPIAIAFTAFGNPDSFFMKALSIFPPTASPVLCARIVLTEVSFIEIFFALLFLILSIWYLRRAAGKIFSLSILMYGKEPSWKEISRWLRESN